MTQVTNIQRMEEENFKCALCLEFFTAPVLMTNCGHNYCQQCLTVMTEFPWLCPFCRKKQHQIPEQMPRNFFLEQSVQNFIETRKNICAVHDLKKKFRKFNFDILQSYPASWSFQKVKTFLKNPASLMNCKYVFSKV